MTITRDQGSLLNGIAITCGDWEDEKSSSKALDETLEKHSAYFKVFKEVSGFYITPRFGQKELKCRIDRILSPKPALIDLGWNHGHIGIESKASRCKAGPALSQLLDYSRAIYTLNPGGFRVLLSWVFLWPFDKPHGTVASFLSQNCIGGAWIDYYDSFNLYSGQECIARIDDKGVNLGKALSGHKAGSRSLEHLA